jgi:hypothetical protein
MVILDPATREKKRVRPPSFPPIVAVSTPKEHHFLGYLYATFLGPVVARDLTEFTST